MAAARTIRLGTADVQFPSPFLSQIADSAPLLADPPALRTAFARDGFVYLRGALGAPAVLAARAAVAEHLAAKGDVLAPGSDSVLLAACGLGCLPMLEGANAVTADARVAGVLEGAPLRAAVGALLAEPPQALRTFDYKWLRAMPRALFTGAHVDAVYMARGSPRLLTCWIPMEAAATLELGALALYRGSHAAPGGLAALRRTYGALDTEAEPGFEGTGWYTECPHDVARLDTEGAGGWVSGDFAAGDVVIFGMHTLHMSTANLTDRVRVSCDVRWQPAADAIDERYTGSAQELREKQAQRKKGGAWAAGAAEGGAAAAAAAPPAPVVTMQDLRAKWGL